MDWYISVEDFLRQELPKLIAEKRTLNALFATYGQVESYQSGPVNTGRIGLNIVVQAGNYVTTDSILKASSASLSLALAGDLEGSHAISEASRQPAISAQANLTSEVAGALEKEECQDFLAIVYAGLSAFEQALEFAQKIKKNAAANVAVLTCNCNLFRKSVALVPLLLSKELSHVIVTPACGGVRQMKEILEGLINAWPLKQTTPIQ